LSAKYLFITSQLFIRAGPQLLPVRAGPGSSVPSCGAARHCVTPTDVCKKNVG